MFVGFLFGE